MVNFRSSACLEAARKISDYDKKSILCAVSGLLTLPSLSANSVRCETLVHLCVTYAKGTKKPTRSVLTEVLNNIMGSTNIGMEEDPQEDVFISNIITENGDLRVFNALWEANDYYIQTLLNIATTTELPERLTGLKDKCVSILKLSEEIAKRSELFRNSSAKSFDKKDIFIPKNDDLLQISTRVVFTHEQILDLGVSIESLAPFIISEDESFQIRFSSLGNTQLEEKPIVAVNGDYIVSLPSSIGIAMRKYFLSECENAGLLKSFSKLLVTYQVSQLKYEILREYRGRYRSVVPEIESIVNLPSMHVILLNSGFGEYLHIILLHDDIENLLKEGFASAYSLPKINVEALRNYCELISNFCKQQNDFKSGQSLITIGGLGRGYSLGFDTWPQQWNFSTLNLNDLFLISGAKTRPLRELFQCLSQKMWIEDNGVNLFNINGDINYLGFWLDNGYKCLTDEMAINAQSMVSLYTDFVFSVRSELREKIDRHSVQSVDGKWHPVERLTKESYYEGMKLKPIYASPGDITNGFLNGVVKTPYLNVWFGISAYPDEFPRNVIYEWWSGFINAIYDLSNFVSTKMRTETNLSVQVNLDFSRLLLMNNILLDSNELRGINIKLEGATLTLMLEENFMANFSQSENFGEKIVLFNVLNGISCFLESNGYDISKLIEPAIEHVLADNAVRFVHVFRSHDPLENLLHNAQVDPIFVDRKDAIFRSIQINHFLGLSDRVIEGHKNCVGTLNQIVDEIWTRIKAALKTVGLEKLLERSFFLLNAIEQDRSQWNRTARAVKAIHSKHDDVVRVAQLRESDRSLASLCLRSIIEMSICESPINGDLAVSEDVVQELLSLCSLLINTAADSDAIHWGLVQPQINFNKNCSYSMPTNFHEHVIAPYFFGHFQAQFDNAVESYEEIYTKERMEDFDSGTNNFPDDFSGAFVAEYGVSVTKAMECWAEIIDMHVELQTPVIKISSQNLITRIVENRELRTDEASAFLNAFALDSRTHWDELPINYSFRDIAPWKYKRRLSSLIRPIIRITDELILSAFLIKQGINYSLERTRNGEFNTEFFNSAPMRSYVGAKIEQRGADFTKLVAEKFRQKGWHVEQELLMRSLGAPAELGDIDVMAIKDEVVIVIECKNLQMAKTVSEIADVCNRFRGEGKDELRKHLNRVTWISKNITSIAKLIGYHKEISILKNLLLTSTEMPMRYRKDLPISCNDIISFKAIDDWLETPN